MNRLGTRPASAELCPCFAQERGIACQCALQNPGLMPSLFPVALLDGFGEPWKLQMTVSETRRVERVLEPGTPGEALGICPIGFHLHDGLVHSRRKAGIGRAFR